MQGIPWAFNFRRKLLSFENTAFRTFSLTLLNNFPLLVNVVVASVPSHVRLITTSPALLEVQCRACHEFLWADDPHSCRASVQVALGNLDAAFGRRHLG